jgi:hypothetical protein
MIENEMGNRGSKSEFVMLTNSVKEQRVDVSWLSATKVESLRCILKDFARNYQVGNPSCCVFATGPAALRRSKQIWFSHTRVTETIHGALPASKTATLQSTVLLNPWFVTGITDGEGCFFLSIVKRNSNKTGWIVLPSFQIGLQGKDIALLEQFKLYFEGGSIIKNGTMASFRAQSIKELTKVISHFTKYPLITGKYVDYKMVEKDYRLLLNKEHFNKEGLAKIVSIKGSLNLCLSDYLRLAFPKVPVTSSLKFLMERNTKEGDNKIPDPQWVAGFTTGDRCFAIRFTKSSNYMAEKK